ncbi:putative bifunctional diguanylate cyclase/phosphodiesterase [Aliihoeflea sp. PC F10.4]
MKLHAIQKHNEQVYLIIQFFLIAAFASAVYVLMVSERGEVAGWLALVGVVATLGGAITMSYLRRSLALRLQMALVAEEDQHRLMSVDVGTNAFSRRHFLDALKDALGKPLEPRPATLLLIDLDHFKHLNDSFGHHCGDWALRHLVATIEAEIPHAIIGRLGGDEFGVLVPGNDVQEAQAAAERLITGLRGGMSYEGKSIALSASVGIAACPDHASDAGELMAVADLALYESKRAGRSRVTLFDTDMVADRRRNRSLERELRAAIYLNELRLEYQPVVNADRSIFAVEALVRWQHPVRGMIPPSEFIPLAEQSSLIDMVGTWVFQRACMDIAHMPDLRISINVSGEQLKRDDIVANFENILKTTGRRADQFVLEITETVAMSTRSDIVQRISKLQSMGFRVALDDFGTGHCGFRYLQKLPINSIKIDRSYIATLESDPVAQIFVSALTQIARIQSITVVAEGIETEEQFALARASGCNRFQGYFFGRPAPYERLFGTPVSSTVTEPELSAA